MGLGALIQGVVAEVLSVLLGAVIILALSALGLYACQFSSSYYILGGLGFTLLFSAAYGLVLIGRHPDELRYAISHSISALSLSCYFFLAVPSTIERSVTVFLVQAMADKKPHSVAEMESRLISGYVCNSAVAKRMAEEEHVGNVKRLEGGEYILTPQGERITGWLAPVGALFSVPHRYVQQGPECTKPPVTH